MSKDIYKMLAKEEIEKIIKKYQGDAEIQRLIREYKSLRFMRPDPDTPRGYAMSVHNKSTVRIDKAQEQLKKAQECQSDRETIINHVKDFLCLLEIDNPEVVCINFENVNYQKLVEDYNLKDERDIVWMKFSRQHFLCTVACSNDINLDFIPKDETDIDAKKEKGKGFKYNTSAVIMNKLQLEWDDEVVIVPLNCIPESLNRGDIETGIGNYLIAQGVPILDYYSHNY